MTSMRDFMAPMLRDEREDPRRMLINHSLERNMGKPMKVALTGLMHDGKSTFADVFREQGYEHRAFAQAIKEMTLEWVTDLEGLLVKLSGRSAQKWGKLTLERILEDKDTYRPLFQFIGAYAREFIGEDAWVKIFESRYGTGYGNGVIVDDLRYMNEYHYLKSQGYLIVRVQRPQKARKESLRQKYYAKHGRDPKKSVLRELMEHESERDVDDIPWHVYIANDGTEEDLRRKATDLIAGRAEVVRGRI